MPARAVGAVAATRRTVRRRADGGLRDVQAAGRALARSRARGVAARRQRRRPRASSRRRSPSGSRRRARSSRESLDRLSAPSSGSARRSRAISRAWSREAQGLADDVKTLTSLEAGRFVHFHRGARPRPVRAGRADRRRRHRSRRRPRHARRHRPDVRDADRRIEIRLPARAPGPARARRRWRCRRSSISATQAILYLPPDMPDPRSPEFNRAAADAIAALARPHARPRVRAVHLLRSHARRVRDGRAPHRLARADAGIGAAIGAAARLPGHAERRAVRDVQLLAGRRCRGRGPQLRHRRSAAVRLSRPIRWSRRGLPRSTRAAATRFRSTRCRSRP